MSTRVWVLTTDHAHGQDMELIGIYATEAAANRARTEYIDKSTDKYMSRTYLEEYTSVFDMDAQD